VGSIEAPLTCVGKPIYKITTINIDPAKATVSKISAVKLIIPFTILTINIYYNIGMISKKSGNFCFIRVDKGEELINIIKKISLQQKIKTASFYGLGAVEKVYIAHYLLKKKQYKITKMNGLFEMTSLIGNIIEKDNEPVIHAHINITDTKRNVYGGHLIKATVWATAEIFIEILPIKLIRRLDENTGLNLIQLPQIVD
jgi:predicted DNA-binding protein with PD1-like motif